jgi:hypothetical protein
MRTGTTMKHWAIAISLMILGGGMSACAMGGTSWKEEVLRHDGNKIIKTHNRGRFQAISSQVISACGAGARPTQRFIATGIKP